MAAPIAITDFDFSGYHTIRTWKSQIRRLSNYYASWAFLNLGGALTVSVKRLPGSSPEVPFFSIAFEQEMPLHRWYRLFLILDYWYGDTALVKLRDTVTATLYYYQGGGDPVTPPVDPPPVDPPPTGTAGQATGLLLAITRTT